MEKKYKVVFWGRKQEPDSGDRATLTEVEAFPRVEAGTGTSETLDAYYSAKNGLEDEGWELGSLVSLEALPSELPPLELDLDLEQAVAS